MLENVGIIEKKNPQNRDDPRVLLLFPPNFSFKQPYLSTPALTAYLRQQSTVGVVQRDLNIEALCYFLCMENLIATYERLAQVDKKRLSDRIQAHAVLEALSGSDVVLNSIADSLDFLRTPHEALDMSQYLRSLRVVEAALEAVSTLYWPTRLTLTSFEMNLSPQSSQQALQAVDSPENPYTTFFAEQVVSSAASDGYGLIGISVASLSQIIPALTLASMLKKVNPTLPIVVGGGVFQRLSSGRLLPEKLFDLVDYFVVGEGERPLAALVESLWNSRPIEEVPGLVYLRDGKICHNEEAQPVSVEGLPPPDFDDLPLSQYLTPKPVLSYQPVRGCYWRRCAFCNEHVVCGDRAEVASAEKTVNDLAYLKQRYNTDAFCLVNESLSPRVLEAICRQMEECGLAVSWYSGARFDSKLDQTTLELLGRNGCRKLFFGLESGSQRVLRKMQKGISTAHAARVLRWCRKIGVAAHVYLMVGFPGETLEDIGETRAFLDEILPDVDPMTFTTYVSVFQLKPDTPVFDDLDKFGIEELKNRPEFDLQYIYDFRTAVSDSIDYDHEAAELVAYVNQRVKGPMAPEDICHFMTYGRPVEVEPDCFEEPGPTDFYRLAPGIRLVESAQGIIPDTESVPAALLYDFFDARWYAVPDKRFAEVLRSLSDGGAPYEVLYRQIEDLGESDPKMTIGELVEQGVLNPVRYLDLETEGATNGEAFFT